MKQVRRAVSFLLAAFLPGGFAQAQQLTAATLPGGLTLPYYVSQPPGQSTNKTDILIIVHGFTRDANVSYQAGALAAENANATASTLVVSPIFQVQPPGSAKCKSDGVPTPVTGNALWHCDDWSDGSPAINGSVTSFQAMDSLVGALLHADPEARAVTIAGFSAGAQFVQRYIGFAHTPPSVSMRYVVSDPSAFLYFDPIRPVAVPASCPNYNHWKFGTENLPASLGRTAAQARQTYVSANIYYLEGALDAGMSKSAVYKLLEKNCAAEVQGQYRLDRGQAYAAYDQAMLAHGAHKLLIVPGCAHSVSCVFPSAVAREALIPND